MIKKLLLLLVFINGFIPNHAAGRVMPRAAPKHASHTSYPEKARKKTFQNKKSTTSKVANRIKYFVIGAIVIIIIYITNKDYDNDGLPEIDKLLDNNNYVFPDVKIPDNTEQIEVDLDKTFADNNPINITGNFHESDQFTIDNPVTIWEHHVAVKKCMAEQLEDYEERRKKDFYRFAYEPSHKELSEDDQKRIGKILENRKDKPMYPTFRTRF